MKIRFLLISFLGLFLFGCSPVEFAKTIYGSSTRRLNALRTNAIQKSFRCGYDECFDTVLALTSTEVDRSPVTQMAYPKDKKVDPFAAGGGASTADTSVTPRKSAEEADSLSGLNAAPLTEAEEAARLAEEAKHHKLELFIKNRRKGEMVVLGVPGAVDTTEVGIFFVTQPDGITRIELPSLSSNAKRAASEIVFAALSEKFSEVTQ